MSSSSKPLLPPVPDLRRRADRRDTQRLRLFRALAELTRQVGWNAVTATKLARRAGVSTKTFYEQFADKEQCLLELYEAMTARAVSSLASGSPSGSEWREQLRLTLERWFELLAAEPDFTHLYALDIWNASPASRRLALQNTSTLTAQLRQANVAARTEDAAVDRLDETELQMLAGAVHRLVVLAAIEDRIEQLPEVAPAATRTLLAALSRRSV